MKHVLLVAGAWLLGGCADVLGVDFQDKRLAEPTLQVLTDASLGAKEWFGSSIDLEGDTLLIGAPPFFAYVAERQASGEWTLVKKFERPNGEAAGTRKRIGFGGNVALHGDWAMIADWGHMDPVLAEPGEVFVYRRGPDGFEWTGQRLQAPGGHNADRFGWDIAIDGTTAAIGAWGDGQVAPYGGGVYVYTLQDEKWELVEKLMLKDAAGEDHFGVAVALERDTLVTSASHKDDLSDTDIGAIYVFTRGAKFGGTDPQELWPSGDLPTGQHLEPVSISGDALFAGAPDANQGRGVAFAFQRTAGRWSGAPLVLPRTNTERATLTPTSRFGKQVAVHGDLAVVTTRESENLGAGYVYRRAGGKWAFSRRVSSELLDGFGCDVKVHGSTVAIGALFAEPGVVYVYEFPDQ